MVFSVNTVSESVQPERSQGPQVEQSVKVQVHLPDRLGYPKLRFVKEFFQHLGLIFIVELGMRIFFFSINIIHALIPVEKLPEDLESYLSISVPRAIVTIMDSVAILLAAILALVMIIRVGREYWKDIKS